MRTVIHSKPGDVSFELDVECVIIDKINAEPSRVLIPLSKDRPGTDVIVVDGRGDADKHPIVPEFSEPMPYGGELYRITSPGGFFRMRARPDGKGWVMIGGSL